MGSFLLSANYMLLTTLVPDLRLLLSIDGACKFSPKYFVPSWLLLHLACCFCTHYFIYQFDVLSMADNAGLEFLNMQLPFVNYLTIFYSHLNHFPSCGDKVI